jgi:hypothetical protein
MSTDAAIAACTATLARLLRQATQSVVVTRPLKNARKDSGTAPYLNLSLYHLAIDPAMRNNPEISRRPGGKNSDGAYVIPLPLDLFYLVTAFSGNEADNAEIQCHRLLGGALRFFHDHPVLNRASIQSLLALSGVGLDALPEGLADSGLADQIERLSISFQPLTDDDYYKIFSAGQAGYSPSVAYRVGVVVIDSQEAGSTAPPVLRRGAEDKGVFTQPGSRIPELREIKVTVGTGIAFPGAELTLLGSGFSSDAGGSVQTQVRLKPMGAGEAVLLDLEPASTEEQLVVKLDPTLVHAGVQAVAVVVQRTQKVLRPDGTAVDESRPWSSNELPFAIAPNVVKFLDATGKDILPKSDGFREMPLVGGILTVRILCEPPLHAVRKEGKPAKFDDAIELLFDGSDPRAPELSLAEKTEADFGIAGRPLTFEVPVDFKKLDPLDPDREPDPNRNVRALRLRVNGVELSKNKPGPNGLPVFDNFVRVVQ